jgi:hypothetical protein
VDRSIISEILCEFGASYGLKSTSRVAGAQSDSPEVLLVLL